MKTPMARKQFEKMLQKEAIRTEEMVVPIIHDGFLRIKVVCTKDFNDLFESGRLHYLQHHDQQYLFGTEAKDMGDTFGIAVSTWVIDPMLQQDPRLSYQFAVAYSKSFGVGYGSRVRAQSFGINSYVGTRLSKRPHPSPFVADEDIPLQQYRNNDGDNFQVLQSVLLKRVNEIGAKARAIAWRLHPSAMKFGGDGCSVRGLITCGLPRRKAGVIPLGFCNTLHVDTCDELPQSKVNLFKSNASDDYETNLLLFPGYCVPTTCAYQFLHNGSKTAGSKTTYQQYFSLDGLGLAVSIKDGMGHSFLGAAFSHRTCICLALSSEEKTVCGSNCNDDFLVFAWGRAGGPKDAEHREENPEGRSNASARRNGPSRGG